ncbi:MAG: hypothetical protein AAGA86_02275 [Bacteroidota bacterium]
MDKKNTDLKLANGVLLYKNTPFAGLLVETYDDTSLKMELQYRDGRKHGHEKRWYPQGQLAQSRSYAHGLKVGNHQGWWEDGSEKFHYHFNEKGEYHGSRKEWYRNGQQLLDFNYVNGKESGAQRMWTASGEIRANYEVRNGERFGLIGLKKCYTVNVDPYVLP